MYFECGPDLFKTKLGMWVDVFFSVQAINERLTMDGKSNIFLLWIYFPFETTEFGAIKREYM